MSYPRLYSRISITPAEESVSRLLPLIYEYAEHPDRAESVREVVFKCHLKEQYSYGWIAGECDAAPLARKQQQEADRQVGEDDILRRQLRVLSLTAEQETAWMKRLTWTNTDLVAARMAETSRERQGDSFYESQDAEFAQYAGTLLLMLCPNIEKLIYEVNPGVMSSILLRNNYDLLPDRHLTKLREVELLAEAGIFLHDPRMYNRLDVLGTMRLFHRLPSLEKVSMHAVGTDVNAEMQYFPPASSAVKTLVLDHVDFATATTGPMIRMAKQLENLTVIAGGRATRGGGWVVQYPRTFAKALARHKKSLRVLDIDMDSICHAGKNGRYLLEEDLPDERTDYERWHHPEAADLGDVLSEIDRQDSTEPLHTWEIEDDSDYDGSAPAPELREAYAPEYRHSPICWESWNWMPPRGNYLKLVDSLPVSLEYLLIRGYQRGQCEYYDAEIDDLLHHRNRRLTRLETILGIDVIIPSGEKVEDPDLDEDLLWVQEDPDLEWVEL
ncbi:hypothetical protein AMS68_004257 [Peltaster fructicola]|uniref:Uncharacterized protein n=1 Tax=Peltaster fructicola TaxID=286661 RepID=A0A6H0XWB8_9PEZI|nr:hypothetical protein AMS68_004257 [Peltaster fructicola]